MNKLSKDQRVHLVRLFYKNDNNAVEALNAYRRDVEPNMHHHLCQPRTVRDIVEKFEDTGSVLDRKRSGRPQIDDDTVMEVSLSMRNIAERNYYGEASTSTCSAETGVPRSTVKKILKKRLQMRPYRIQKLHQLERLDPARRLEFAQMFLARAAVDDEWSDRILYSDEAVFTECGQVNSWNTRIWAEENPHAFIEQPLHSKKVIVWIGFTANFILGPYFYQDYNENGDLVPINVNGANYYEMLDEFVIPRLADMGELERTTFQQDGAPAHVWGGVLDLLRREFPGRLISRFCPPFFWPARSPDLTPMDFWLWPELKSMVYRTPPANMLDLRHKIAEAVHSLVPEQLRNASRGVLHRLDMVVDQQGGHIEHLLNR